MNDTKSVPISSRRNSKVQHLRMLSSQRGYREETGEFIGDGIRLFREAAQTGFVTEAFVTADYTGFETGNIPLSFVTPEILQYISPLSSAQNIVFTCRLPKYDITLSEDSGYIVLDNVQDPGNVGTIIRTAAAMKFKAVLLVNACADPFSPKCIRSTMGAVFKIPVIQVSIPNLQNLANRGLRLYGAELSESAENIRETDLSGASIILGSEGAGLSPETRAMCEKMVYIPISGDVESLNVAVAASIFLWEASKCLF